MAGVLRFRSFTYFCYKVQIFQNCIMSKSTLKKNRNIFISKKKVKKRSFQLVRFCTIFGSFFAYIFYQGKMWHDKIRKNIFKMVDFLTKCQILTFKEKLCKNEPKIVQKRTKNFVQKTKRLKWSFLDRFSTNRLEICTS